MAIKEYPFYIKSTVILLGLVLVAYSLNNLKGVLTPVGFAMVIAILLNPLVNRFRKMRIPQLVSILLSILIALCIISAIAFFVSSQIIGFSENLPILKEKFYIMLGELQRWLQREYGLGVQTQVKLLRDAVESSRSVPGQVLNTALSTLGIILLIPVYVFLFLFYKTLILNFLYEVFADENTKKVAEVLVQTKRSIQSYMIGVVLETIVVAILNTSALLILGVEYALLIGILGGLLNMIPYIGGLIAIALPVLITTMTQEGFSTQMGIIIAYLIIQFIDNNILVPRIVSSKVQINALVSIFTVLLGGALWGIPGMFLTIPFIAILKIIFDRVEELKPWGKLLGDEIPTRHRGQIWRRKKKPTIAEEIVDNVSKGT